MEETLQPLLGHHRFDGARVDARARCCDGFLVEIGGKDLQRILLLRADLVQCLPEDDGQRVSLLAGGTGRHPGAQYGAVGVARQQRRNHLGPELLPDIGIAKELGDTDQQFVEQQFRFLRALTQVTQVVDRSRQLVQRHAVLDAPQQNVFAVLRKIMARLGVQQDDGFLDKPGSYRFG